ncbi:hypothetical protein KM043_011652 [Ampulex compressa]|nr:hypothetical protein KM043_011652 [Ampulex compressa]
MVAAGWPRGRRGEKRARDCAQGKRLRGEAEARKRDNVVRTHRDVSRDKGGNAPPRIQHVEEHGGAAVATWNKGSHVGIGVFRITVRGGREGLFRSRARDSSLKMYGTNESHGPNHGPWTPPPAPQPLPPQAQHQNHPRPHPHNHPSHPPYVPPPYQHPHHHLPPQIFMHKNAMQMHARELGASALTARPGGGVAGGLAGLGVGVGVGVGPGGMIAGNEVKPHQCQQCLKSFSSNHQLVQHIRVHTGEKPYKCSYCDRRFKQLSHVQQHTRLHTGERPYKCHLPDCGRAFIQLSNLQQHLRNHDAQVERAKNRPFHCNICGKGFATESSLRTHTSKRNVYPNAHMVAGHACLEILNYVQSSLVWAMSSLSNPSWFLDRARGFWLLREANLAHGVERETGKPGRAYELASKISKVANSARSTVPCLALPPSRGPKSVGSARGNQEVASDSGRFPISAPSERSAGFLSKTLWNLLWLWSLAVGTERGKARWEGGGTKRWARAARKERAMARRFGIDEIPGKARRVSASASPGTARLGTARPLEETRKRGIGNGSGWARSGRRTYGPQPPSENNLHAAAAAAAAAATAAVAAASSSSSLLNWLPLALDIRLVSPLQKSSPLVAAVYWCLNSHWYRSVLCPACPALLVRNSVVVFSGSALYRCAACACFRSFFFRPPKKELQQRVVFQQHAALIGGPNATSCPVCHKLFLGGEALMEHMKHTHKDPNASGVATKRRTANHPCPVCGKHYVNEGSLRKHLACHPETSQLSTSLRMWPCSVCQAVFTHESGLLNHMEHMRMDPKHQFAAQYVLSRAAAERREREILASSTLGAGLGVLGSQSGGPQNLQQPPMCPSPSAHSDSSSGNGRLSSAGSEPDFCAGTGLLNNNNNNNNNNMASPGPSGNKLSEMLRTGSQPGSAQQYHDEMQSQQQRMAVMAAAVSAGLQNSVSPNLSPVDMASLAAAMRMSNNGDMSGGAQASTGPQQQGVQATGQEQALRMHQAEALLRSQAEAALRLAVSQAAAAAASSAVGGDVRHHLGQHNGGSTSGMPGHHTNQQMSQQDTLSPDLGEALRLQEQRLEQALRLHGDPRALSFTLQHVVNQQNNQQP